MIAYPLIEGFSSQGNVSDTGEDPPPVDCYDSDDSDLQIMLGTGVGAMSAENCSTLRSYFS